MRRTADSPGGPDRTKVRRLRGALPLVQRPLLSALLAMLLVADYDSITSQPGAKSTIAGALGTIVPYRRSTAYRRQIELYFVREPGDLRVIDPEAESWDELSRLLAERPGDVVQASYRPREGERGTWAMTTAWESYAIEFTDFGRPMSKEEVREAYQMFAERLERDRLYAPHAAIIRAGPVRRERTLWLGYGHNLVSAALLAAFVLSLGWVPGAPARWRARRRARALSRGRCPRCGYSIAGLERMKCPECGAEWNEAEVGAARGAAGADRAD